MAVMSIRLNTKEEKMLDALSSYFEKERSSLIKQSLRELYEDVIDRSCIDEFEEREKSGSVSYVQAEDILKEL